MTIISLSIVERITLQFFSPAGGDVLDGGAVAVPDIKKNIRMKGT